MSLIVTAVVVGSITACRGVTRLDPLDDIAERYVRLALALGERDPDYIDSYYGPPAWTAEAERKRDSLESIQRQGRELLAALRKGGDPRPGEPRRRALERQLDALVFRARFLAGERVAFDEEMAALFDIVVPRREEREFEEPLARVATVLAGRGPMASRYVEWMRAFTVPSERFGRVWDAALHACRDRTRAHIRLPASETLSVEYVADGVWNAFTRYEGNFRSRARIDASSPLTIDRVLDLACHEGYPGHHAIGILIDETEVRGNGWIEFTIEPLYGPHAFLMEGAASLGPEVAFSDDERRRFEREVLFPAAGLDPARAGELASVRQAVHALGPAIVEGVRRYLAGELDAPRFMFWLERYGLMADQERMLKFVNQYRGYAIAYHEAAAVVRAHIGSDPERRWDAFRSLVTSPMTPSHSQ